MVDRFLALAGGQLGRGQTVADLADAMGITTATLDRACHAARGRRAVDLLNDLRLERAARLLRESRQSPTQIAHDLGYSSLGHFTRAFAAATGRSPEVFRAQSC